MPQGRREQQEMHGVSSAIHRGKIGMQGKSTHISTGLDSSIPRTPSKQAQVITTCNSVPITNGAYFLPGH